MAKQGKRKQLVGASSDDESEEQHQPPHSDEEDNDSDEENSEEEEAEDSNIERKYSKRPAPHTQHILKVSKGKKAKVGNGGDDKKFGIGKLWSENDEIALLQGMIDFKSEKGVHSDLIFSQFYEFVDPLLSVHGSKIRLSEKMRRLKNKYKINVKNGIEEVFSKPHEHKLFVLSNKIWGGEASSKKDDKFANKSQLKDEEDKEATTTTTDLLSLFPHLVKALELDASTYVCVPNNPKEYVKEKISSFGEEKAKELEEGWKGVRVMEYELYGKFADLKYKQTQAILDAVKPLESSI